MVESIQIMRGKFNFRSAFWRYDKIWSKYIINTVNDHLYWTVEYCPEISTRSQAENFVDVSLGILMDACISYIISHVILCWMFSHLDWMLAKFFFFCVCFCRLRQSRSIKTQLHHQHCEKLTNFVGPLHTFSCLMGKMVPPANQNTGFFWYCSQVLLTIFIEILFY